MNSSCKARCKMQDALSCLAQLEQELSCNMLKYLSVILFFVLILGQTISPFKATEWVFCLVFFSFADLEPASLSTNFGGTPDNDLSRAGQSSVPTGKVNC